MASPQAVPGGIELRTWVFLDAMQPAFASFIATTSKGFLPVEGQAALFIEVAPGIAINRITDVALKADRVRPGLQVVERAFGLLEVHSDRQSEVLSAGEAVLQRFGLRPADRLRPEVTSLEVITNVDPYQAQLVNRIRYGDMLLAGESLFILEVRPAGYVTLAANEAEKAAPVKLVQMQPFGAFGRLYLGGGESEIRAASEAAQAALQALEGREASR